MSTEMIDFVEITLSAEDQRALSKEWYGDSQFSEKEISEYGVDQEGFVCDSCKNCKSWLMASCAEDCNSSDVTAGVCVEFDPKSRMPTQHDNFYDPGRNWTDHEMDVYL